MTQINFSQFDKLCIFLDPELSLDGFGGYYVEWKEVYNSWSQLLPIIPDRKSQGLRPLHPWTHRLFTRFHTVIREGMQLRWLDEVYLIDQLINHEEKSRYLELMLIRRPK
jgi:hypothetical protein